MFVYFLFLIIVFAVPADLDKYNVLIINFPYPVPKKSVEVYILPKRTVRETYVLPERTPRHHRLSRLDISSLEEPTEVPNIDHFEAIAQLRGRDENLRPYYRSLDVGYGIIEDSPALPNEMDVDETRLVDPDDRIVGGAEVDINMYPYHVGYGTNCGGAIIGSKWVVTAGHCGKKPYIRTGSKYLNQGKRIEVKTHNIHPNWSAKTKEHPFDYDFQILELKEELKFDENTQPIKIAHIEDMVIGKMITVTGWGNTEENGPYSTVLRAVSVPIIAKDNCQKVPFAYFRGGLTPRMFCAGYREGKKDACQGDSGGPAVAYDRLLGMVSFGYGCATPGSYGVYSKVAKVRDWIQAVTGLRYD